jgi:myo-inositol-1(or 4)-monophosphatase
MERELDIATRAARAAGQVLLRHYGGAHTVTEKSVDNPVTAADLEANELLKSTILGVFPGDGWLSEETADSDERLGRKRVWIVDPLDGTKEFISEIPEFVVCVSLVEDGLPRIAVEYNPVRDELFTARKGHGASLNGTPIRATKQTDLRHARVLASRSEEARGEWEAYRDKMHVELTGSVAYKFALVAAGRFDATFTLTPKNEWDVCAGALLVAEAGGMVTDPDGRAIRFNNPSTLLPGLVASNQLLHRAILNTIRATRAAME